LAAKDNFHGGAAAWWEQAAKPAVQAFCRSFSKTVAVRNAETRRFFTQALELALARSDWPAVEACRHKLSLLDRQLAAGLALRAHIPLLPDELPSVFLLASEGCHGRSPGLEAVKTAAGQIIRDPDGVQQEVFAYFDTLFQGRHQATAAAPEPCDSGRPFKPSSPEAAADFLSDMPSLSPAQSQALDRPFELSELKAAIASAAKSKSPGLDGLSYELYAAVIDLVGPGLLQAFNAMLRDGLLTPSFCRGVVRLLPKVAGTPTAAQLRPITLLNTDYKLLTKMFVARLLPILPDVLQSS
jgi:hypothetical protein